MGPSEWSVKLFYHRHLPKSKIKSDRGLLHYGITDMGLQVPSTYLQYRMSHKCVSFVSGKLQIAFLSKTRGTSDQAGDTQLSFRGGIQI